MTVGTTIPRKNLYKWKRALGTLTYVTGVKKGVSVIMWPNILVTFSAGANSFFLDTRYVKKDLSVCLFV